MAKAKYFVMDSQNIPSWKPDSDETESFDGFIQARKRAIEIAECVPGESVHICKSVEVVMCPVGAAIAEPAV